RTFLALSWLITYWSRAVVIWRGVGSFAAAGLVRGVSSISSSMISWQRLMHSSQMSTPWPAMSFRTCSWLFPQKEQRYGTLGPFDVPLVVTEIASSLALRLLVAVDLVGVRLCGRFLGLRGRVRDAAALSARQTQIMRPRDQRIARGGVDVIDDAIVLGRLGRHEKVPVRVLDDLVERLLRVVPQELVGAADEELPLLHLDRRVRGRPAEPAGALVDHDPAVRQGVALALGPGREQHRGHRCRHPDADRRDGSAHVLHRVVDRETARHDATGRVDVEADV